MSKKYFLSINKVGSRTDKGFIPKCCSINFLDPSSLIEIPEKFFNSLLVNKILFLKNYYE